MILRGAHFKQIRHRKVQLWNYNLEIKECISWDRLYQTQRIRSYRQSAWTTSDGGSWHCTGGIDRDHPQEKEMQKAKWLSEEALQIAEKKRSKSKEEERYTHLNGEFQRIARRDKKVFLSDQCKEIEKNNRMGKTRHLFKKIRDTNRIFLAKMGTIRDRNGTHLQKQKILRKGGKNTQKNYTKKI